MVSTSAAMDACAIKLINATALTLIRIDLFDIMLSLGFTFRSVDSRSTSLPAFCRTFLGTFRPGPPA
jgi:hypothetical protein